MLSRGPNWSLRPAISSKADGWQREVARLYQLRPKGAVGFWGPTARKCCVLQIKTIKYVVYEYKVKVKLSRYAMQAKGGEKV
jgi:hypothetical protein